MRQVVLPGSGLRVSRLSFGTGSLHHLASSQRRSLLALALELGFTHFDTSPYYGFGSAEAALGSIAKGSAGELSVATKVGLYPPNGARGGTVQVWTRKALGKLVPALSRPVLDWSIAAAESSLSASLGRLRRDSVDLLLLHEPDASAIASDEFLGWLERQRRDGRIRAWGLAGEAESVVPWLPAHGLAMVLQVRDSLEGRQADALRAYGREPQITFGYLSARPWHAPAAGVAAAIEGALRRNPAGSVIVSSRRAARLAQLAAAARRGDASPA